jgi:hypothetical protein
MDIFHQSSLIFQIVTGTLPILFVIFLKRNLRIEFVILFSASVITTLILYITAMLGIKNWYFGTSMLVLKLSVWQFFTTIY